MSGFNQNTVPRPRALAFHSLFLGTHCTKITAGPLQTNCRPLAVLHPFSTVRCTSAPSTGASIYFGMRLHSPASSLQSPVSSLQQSQQATSSVALNLPRAVDALSSQLAGVHSPDLTGFCWGLLGLTGCCRAPGQSRPSHSPRFAIHRGETFHFHFFIQISQVPSSPSHPLLLPPTARP